MFRLDTQIRVQEGEEVLEPRKSIVGKKDIEQRVWKFRKLNSSEDWQDQRDSPSPTNMEYQKENVHWWLHYIQEGEGN